MTETLSEAIERLHLGAGGGAAAAFGDGSGKIDDILFQQSPRKRRKQDPAELKAALEKKYLSPSTEFSTEWLNRLQQYVTEGSPDGICDQLPPSAPLLPPSSPPWLLCPRNA